MIVKQFWPTTLFSRLWADHAAEAPGLIQHLYRIRDAAPARIASGVAPAAKSASGLFESDFDLLDDDHSGLRRLRFFIQDTVSLAVWHVNGQSVPRTRLTIELVESWFHITNQGGFHDAHFHGGCSWCGIYCLQLGEAGPGPPGGAPNGGNRFYSPLRLGGAHIDYGNQYLEYSFIDPPLREGMLLLFPSYLLHSGLPYRGRQDRIVISFNSRVTLN
jgi:uncharacterized protein (TIGR02466 family)